MKSGKKLKLSVTIECRKLNANLVFMYHLSSYYRSQCLDKNNIVEERQSLYSLLSNCVVLTVLIYNVNRQKTHFTMCHKQNIMISQYLEHATRI